MVTPKFASRKEAQAEENRWFSRRHKTREAHDATRAACVKKRKKKIIGADERALKASERTSAEQLRRLDKRLGKGIGAKKERAKLARRMGK